MRLIIPVILLLSFLSFTCRKDCIADIDNVCDVRSNEWFPLNVGNEWRIQYGGPEPSSVIQSIVGSETKNSRTYMKMKITNDNPGVPVYYEYYRIDSIGNILNLDTITNLENVFFPAQPVRGLIFGPHRDSIMSIDSTVEIKGCTHEHLVVTKKLAASIDGNDYYKKGVGLLYAYDYFSTAWVTGCYIH